jgi:hypothetical protein
VWEENHEAYLQRIDQFLGIAAKHNIRTMLFCLTQFGIQTLNWQAAITKHNVHNSGWVQCPGYEVLNNPDRYDELHGYVQGIVSHFKDDERVISGICLMNQII